MPIIQSRHIGHHLMQTNTNKTYALPQRTEGKDESKITPMRIPQHDTKNPKTHNMSKSWIPLYPNKHKQHKQDTTPPTKNWGFTLSYISILLFSNFNIQFSISHNVLKSVYHSKYDEHIFSLYPKELIPLLIKRYISNVKLCVISES